MILRHYQESTRHHNEAEELKAMPVHIRAKAGKCQGGFHKIGDEITVDWTTPEGICLGAWNALSPCVITLLCEGNFPWEKEKNS